MAMRAAPALVATCVLLALSAAQGLPGSDLIVKILPPGSLTTPPAGVRLSAATDANWTRLPDNRQEDLRKAVVQPLCRWLRRFRAEELCYTSGSKAVFDSQVKTWTATCASLYGGLASRLASWSELQPGDITVAIACEEAFPLIRSGCQAAGPDRNVFQTTPGESCQALQSNIVDRIEEFGNSVPEQYRQMFIDGFLYAVPPVPTSIASDSSQTCRRALAPLKVKADPCSSRARSVIQSVAEGAEVTYTGLAFSSCGSLWSGVVVNQRLGFVEAASLGYCDSDEKRCSLPGYNCNTAVVDTSDCCSSVCSSWFGTIVFRLEDVDYPFKTFDDVLKLQFDVCSGIVPTCAEA